MARTYRLLLSLMGLFIVSVFLLWNSGFCEQAHSANYRLAIGKLGGGGADIASENYRSNGAIDKIETGRFVAGTFVNYAGFWYTIPTSIVLVDDLIAYVESLDLPKGIENSLISKLRNTIKSLEKGRYNAAANQLNAFIHEVEALRGKKLTDGQADALIAKAQEAIAMICAEGGDPLAKRAVVRPDRFALCQNSPNPFNPVTRIGYVLPQASEVQLTIYTVLGQKVATLVSGHQESGHYEVVWDGSGLGNGVYLYHLRAGGFVETKRMVLLK